MIHLKTPQEIEIMKIGGKILKDVLKSVREEAKPGVKLSYLDELAQNLIVSKGASPSFKRVKGYKWTICACVNDVVVHGIPTDYKIAEGDVVGIDCGVYYQGFHTDAAWTIKVENGKWKMESGKDEVDRFLETGEKAFREAIKQVKLGNYIYDISKAIQDNVEGANYSVVKTLVGHGVGRELHEEPEIPCFTKGKREMTPELVTGMVLAIEIIYNMGSKEVVYKGNDGWTIATKDGRISGLFEATVAVTSHGCLVLT
ncbi:type I methionyl aminopeptidase [Candidatus Gottesmanbacteria bacterium]|nr:type I methionyl aminopeptidase [Candidatus Gottesmanbacteria bacterium]MBI5452240.1 type I methionyl aminopeptidase [Candidatus Gottesmanbacteria bacterium]